MTTSLMASTAKAIAATGLALGCATGFAGGGTLDAAAGNISFASTTDVEALADIFTFSLVDASQLTINVNSPALAGQQSAIGAIELVGPEGSFSFSPSLSNGIQTWGFAARELPAGNYTLTLWGLDGAAIGVYAGSMDIAPLPVPEPGTVWMLAAGMLAVGGWMRSRAR